jgi:hypothetical protein
VVTNLTALIIATRDDIICTSAGPVDGKYIGWITLGPDSRYRPLLNSDAIYNSHEEAISAMKELVDAIKHNKTY